MVRELARSSKGDVLLARRRRDGLLVVLKERRVAELGRGRSVLNEVELLSKLEHRALVTLQGYFHDRGALFMELEFAQYGDLRAEVESRAADARHFSAVQLAHVMRELVEGLAFLHRHRVVHRDVKSSNVFVFDAPVCGAARASGSGRASTSASASASASAIASARLDASPGEGARLAVGQSAHAFRPVRGLISSLPEVNVLVKIGDLGVSRECSSETIMLDSFYGTPLYASPEICRNEQYGAATDLWSAGVLFYELAALRHPFSGRSLVALAGDICAGRYEPLPDHVPIELRQIVHGMLKVRPRDRLGTDRVLEMIDAAAAALGASSGASSSGAACASGALDKPRGEGECHELPTPLDRGPPGERPVKTAASAQARATVTAAATAATAAAVTTAAADVAAQAAAAQAAADAAAKLPRLRAELRRKRIVLANVRKWGEHSLQEEELTRGMEALESKVSALEALIDALTPGVPSTYHPSPLVEMVAQVRCGAQPASGENRRPQSAFLAERHALDVGPRPAPGSAPSPGADATVPERASKRAPDRAPERSPDRAPDRTPDCALAPAPACGPPYSPRHSADARKAASVGAAQRPARSVDRGPRRHLQNQLKLHELVSVRDERGEEPISAAAQAVATEVDCRAARNKAKSEPTDPQEEVDYVTRMRVRSQRLASRLAARVDLQAGRRQGRTETST